MIRPLQPPWIWNCQCEADDVAGALNFLAYDEARVIVGERMTQSTAKSCCQQAAEGKRHADRRRCNQRLSG
jgi:hypothetical protein